MGDRHTTAHSGSCSPHSIYVCCRARGSPDELTQSFAFRQLSGRAGGDGCRVQGAAHLVRVSICVARLCHPVTRGLEEAVVLRCSSVHGRARRCGGGGRHAAQRRERRRCWRRSCTVPGCRHRLSPRRLLLLLLIHVLLLHLHLLHLRSHTPPFAFSSVSRGRGSKGIGTKRGGTPASVAAAVAAVAPSASHASAGGSSACPAAASAIPHPHIISDHWHSRLG